MEDKEVKNINNEEVKKEEKKKSGRLFNVLLSLAVVGCIAFVGYKLYDEFWPRSNNISDIYNNAKNDKAGRKMFYYDRDHIVKKSEWDKKQELLDEELNGEPYRNSSLMGGQIVFNFGGRTEPFSISEVFKNGKLDIDGDASWASLRHPEDEEVDPNQTYEFNTFVSYTRYLDLIGKDKKLNDEEIEQYAQRAEQIALSDQSPVYYYVGNLIRSLKGTNPTLSSVYYLMEANRISVKDIVNNSGVTIESYENYLDTSYKGSQEKSLVYTYTDGVELVNEKTLLNHINSEGSMTLYGIEDLVKAISTTFTGVNSYKDGNDVYVAINHYKNISNYFLAEYFIVAGFMNVENENILPGDFSNYKPAFTWCISPKIEEIASVYYDLVEPDVYQGKFTCRDDYYVKTVEKLKDKYTLEEVKSAVMTYEYWALID